MRVASNFAEASEALDNLFQSQTSRNRADLERLQGFVNQQWPDPPPDEAPAPVPRRAEAPRGVRGTADAPGELDPVLPKRRTSEGGPWSPLMRAILTEKALRKRSW